MKKLTLFYIIMFIVLSIQVLVILVYPSSLGICIVLFMLALILLESVYFEVQIINKSYKLFLSGVLSSIQLSRFGGFVERIFLKSERDKVNKMKEGIKNEET